MILVTLVISASVSHIVAYVEVSFRALCSSVNSVLGVVESSAVAAVAAMYLGSPRNRIKALCSPNLAQQ